MIVFLIGTVFGVFVGLVLLALVRFVRRGHHIAETFSPVAPAEFDGLGDLHIAPPELADRVRSFLPSIEGPILECACVHKLHNTGGIFYQSVGLIECSHCRGWQAIRKGIK